MSSRRYQEDIRRIVGMPDVAGGLDDDLPRMRIDGARGIFLIGSGETQSGSAPGGTDGSGGTGADGNDKDPITPPEGGGNTNEDGSGTGDGNTDAGATNPDDFIDDEDESNWDVGDDLFGGNWGGNGGTTFADCVDNTCIEIVDGDKGYIPPEGWDSADDPPIDPDYSSDHIWKVELLGGPNACDRYPGDYATAGGAFSAWKSCVALNAPDYLSNTQGSRQFRSVTRTNPDQQSYEVRFVYSDSGTEPTPWGPLGKVFRQETSTPLPPPYPEFWPSDNCIQLAKNADGQWAASSYESPNDMTAKYSEPKSSLDLCTPSGDGVQILPGADGGTVYWNYTTGIFRAVSPDGKQSFGGSSGVTQAVAGSVAGGADGPKGVGSAVPSG